VETGGARLFEDGRITWAIEQLGGLTGRRVLELGPLEGGHTSMLEAAGAEVIAVESNARAYLKCLVVKELLGLRSRFLYGDFLPYLEQSGEQFDAVVASGVLYHMVDPLRLLDLMAGHADVLVLWTHYFDAARLMSSPMARQFTGEPQPVSFRGEHYLLHPREYLEALQWAGFCGGAQHYARWMERPDLLRALDRLGFHQIDIGLTTPTTRTAQA
jgi:hypothetical protein